MQPLHHGPSQGGDAETRKYRDWYEKTLASYRRFFGEEPPSDIWPTTNERITIKPDFVRVDRRRVWLIPKPAIGVQGPAASVVLVAASGCGGWLEVGGPWDLRGPDFLKLYAILFLAVWFAVLVIRFWARRSPATATVGEESLTPYEAAYLTGGKERAVACAVASLVQRGHLKRNVFHIRQVDLGLPLPVDADPLEAAIVKKVGDRIGATYRDLFSWGNTSRECRALDENLVEKGFLLTFWHGLRIRLLSFGMFFLLLAFGLSKIYVGLERNRPVGFLAAFCVVTALFGLAFFFWKTRPTCRAKAALRKLRKSHASWERWGKIQQDTSPIAVAWAVALFSVDVLRGSSLQGLVAEFMIVPASTGGAVGSDFSTSGGGGGGGGCGGGGGGGGGGGCGGCGG